MNKMLNFSYVYFSNNSEILNEDETKEIIKIIIKYSFPNCIDDETITEVKKILIVNNEFEFIKNKVNEKNIKIIIKQVPRIIYDLFNIIFLIKKYNEIIIEKKNIKDRIKKNEIDKKFNYSFINIDKYKNSLEIKNYFNEYLFGDKKQFRDINFINEEIIKNIKNIELTLDDWKNILFQKIDEINDISIYSYDYIIGRDNDRIKYILYLILLIELGYTYEENFDKYGQIKDFADIDLQNYQDEIDIRIKNRYNINNIKIRSDGNIYTNKFILYRGVKNNNFESDYIKDSSFVHSISYNTSVLNGFMYDKTACTFCSYFQTNDIKQYIILNKFFNNNETNQSKVFYIPIIPLFYLIRMTGEFWHARTKIPKEFINYKEKIIGITHINEIEIPSYLLTDLNLDDLNDYYKLFCFYNKKEFINRYAKKYIKYKIKYLKLKNQMNNFNQS